MTTDFETTGRLWLRKVVDADMLARLRDLADTDRRPGALVARGDALFGMVQNLPVSRQITRLFPGMVAVRMLSFNKSVDANWSVPWHQDRVIAVDRKTDLNGFSNWSHKGGTWHCEPPVEILRDMLFVRLHLDPQTIQNGAMEIALCSHRFGVVSTEQAAELASGCQTECVIADPGDVLILNMLTLHRSRSAANPSSRAALRIDFASTGLPVPLNWAV